MWLETWGGSHYPNARWLAYCDLHIFAWEFVEMLNYVVVPIERIPLVFFLLIFQVNLNGQRSFSGG